jgi:nucleoside phosphorylase
VEKTLYELFRGYEVEALISTGFAAGLDYKLKVGDIILARQLSISNGKKATISANSTFLERAKAILDKNEIHYRVGEITTVDRIARKEVKFGYLKQEPIGLDMESFWVARLAEMKRIPYLIGRVIVDRVDDNLPTLIQDNGERYCYPDIFSHLLIHPWELIYYMRLTMASRKAAGSICRLIISLVRGLKGDYGRN